VNTIWKFGLSVTDGPQTLEIPKRAELLHVADQHGIPTLWMLVDTDAELVTRHFVVHGTGHPIDLGSFVESYTETTGGWLKKTGRGLKYVGTAVGTSLVWHVFENTDATF